MNVNPIQWFREQSTGIKIAVTAGLATFAVVAVAILVVLAVVGAAVVGAFALGVGEGVEEGPGAEEGIPAHEVPQVTFTIEEDGNDPVVGHDGGDPVPAGELLLVFDARDGQRVASTWADVAGVSPDEYVEAGDAASLSVDAEPGDEIRIVWTPDGSERVVLFEYAFA